MVMMFEDLQKVGKEGMEAGIQSMTAASNGAQAIAVEFADYTRKAFEQGTSAAEKLLSARTVERAIEVQSDYARTCYESMIAQATKFGALYADMAKASYRPLEGYVAKITPVA